jgi:hypothetical protein
VTLEAPFKRLRFEYHPEPEESLVGAFVSACHAHPLIRVSSALEGGGINLVNCGAVQVASDEMQKILARIMRTDPRRLNAIAFAYLETRRKVALGDLHAPRSAFDWRVRRIGPTSLLRSPVHRSAWLNRLLPYCPESLELLVHECSACGPLGWVRTRGIDTCEQCGTLLPPSAQPPLPDDLIADYRDFALLMSRNSAGGARIIETLPQALHGFSRTTIASVMLRAATAFSGSTDNRRSIEKIVVGRPEAIAGYVCAGIRLLREWPHSIQGTVATSMDAVGGDVSGYDKVRAAVRWIALDAGSEGKAMIASAFPDLDGRSVNTFAIAARRYYTTSDTNRLLATSSKDLALLRQNDVLPFEQLPSGRRFRARYDADEVDEIHALLRSGISFETVAERFKLPVYAVGQAAAIGVVRPIEHAAVVMLAGRICDPRSLAEFETSIRSRAGHVPGIGISLRSALKKFPGEKPWGMAIAAMMSGELNFRLRNGQLAGTEIFIDAASSGFPSAGATIVHVDHAISDLISLRDVCEILGTAFDESVAALKSARIDAIRVKRMRGVERRQLLTLCSEIAFIGEAAAWSAINPQRLQAKFVKLGVPRRHGGWVRRNLADLGYVSHYVVK